MFCEHAPAQQKKGGFKLVIHGPQNTADYQHTRVHLFDNYDSAILLWRLPHIEAPPAIPRVYVTVREKLMPAAQGRHCREKSCAGCHACGGMLVNIAIWSFLKQGHTTSRSTTSTSSLSDNGGRRSIRLRLLRCCTAMRLASAADGINT